METEGMVLTAKLAHHDVTTGQCLLLCGVSMYRGAGPGHPGNRAQA